ncbi:type VI secretion system baseplate subunit TssG [Sphingomonas sp. R-74633]|uniref:type VI secretion system baseplate subunit TssG n=1 Tax=Sphingomonas sp. R-74633 TaxID=2751188 RepID=UPI0015D1AE46|nr:type VI secretion system baseplate subunit TssG [Sphingomonas sp. R-74633]NYT43208.1 type VI secretion system baseplate subunit TssG [Sphingomonas sp. R-74633]
MASPRRGPANSLINLLVAEPYRFDTHQAVRVLEAWRKRAKLGPVRYRSNLSLAFPLSDLESVRLAPQGQPPEVTVNYIGLGGATGPLPTPYTEYVSESARRGHVAARDFLDLFNHRLVTASLDLARLYRPALQAQRPQESLHAGRLHALLGLATPSLVARDPRLTASLLPLAGLLNQAPLSAHAIERSVSSQFSLPARVTPFRGAWMDVPVHQRTALGARGRHQRLGRSAMLGGRVWDQSAGITLTLGPMSAERADAFLPGVRNGHLRLAKLLRFLLSDTIAVEVRLHVTRTSVPRARLGGTGRMRLGWNAWLKQVPVPEDAGTSVIVLRPPVAVPVGVTKR